MPSLGEQEMELLHFMVERGGATVRDAVDEFGLPRGLARTTVLTMMERLRKKGFLKRREGGGAGGGKINIYTPSSPPADIMTGAVKTFVEKALGGSVSPIVAYLAEQVDVSDDEMDELRKMITRLESRREGADK